MPPRPAMLLPYAERLTGLREWERSVTLTLNRHTHAPLWQRFFAAISRMGDGALWGVLGISLLLLGGTAGQRCALHMAIAAAISLTLYKLCKRYACRPRPCASLRELHVCVAPLDEGSFPSGHTLHAVLFSAVIVAHFPEAAVALVPFVVLTALSRVVLGLHYPSDVLGGAALGAAVAILSFAFA